MSPRTEKQFEIIRAEKVKLISETALKLFATKGYESTSVSMIAQNAGISKGLMYNYFKSKDDLLRLILRSGVESFMNVLKVNNDDNIKKEEIIAFINVNIEALKQKPTYYKLYFSLILQPQVYDLIKEEIMPMFDELFKKITNYFEQKGDENPYVKARYFMALFDGIGIHYIADTENFPLDEIQDILVKQL